MRRRTSPLALDHLSPIGIRPIAKISPTTDPLALEPLSAPSPGARSIDAGFSAADTTANLALGGADAARQPAGY